MLFVTRNHSGISESKQRTSATIPLLPSIFLADCCATLSIQFFIQNFSFFVPPRREENSKKEYPPFSFPSPFVYGKKAGGWVENLQTALLSGLERKREDVGPEGGGLINFSVWKASISNVLRRRDFYLLDPRRNRNERNGTIVNLSRINPKISSRGIPIPLERVALYR